MNFKRHKLGVGGRYGAVEQTLCGGEAGTVGGGSARVVDYVAANSEMDTVDLGLVRADVGNHAGIGNLAVGADAGLGT